MDVCAIQDSKRWMATDEDEAEVKLELTEMLWLDLLEDTASVIQTLTA